MEDFKGTSLDDAINDRNHPQQVKWPNEVYRGFIELITEYRLSNACGDKIIKWFNASTSMEESPLPKSTKEGREFLNKTGVSYLDFKETPITTFQETEYIFYYRPIIQGIKALLLQSGATEEFALSYQRKTEIRDGLELQVYGEQFESEWWKEMESNIPLDNRLLSIILYADSTTCDQLGKTSEHPIYLSLGNIPNWRRDKPYAKVLLGYLPKLKAKDMPTRNSDTFRQLQRQVFQRCLRILLTPILNKKDMYFNIKQQIYAFTPKISVILADMAEAGLFTGTYIPSTSRRPCCNCYVTNEDLNNMTLSNITLRTPEKMEEIINAGQSKEYSIHNEKNFFWNFRLVHLLTIARFVSIFIIN